MIRLLEIQFDSQTSIASLVWIITCAIIMLSVLSIRNKAGLQRVDNVPEAWFHSVNKNLANDFYTQRWITKWIWNSCLIVHVIIIFNSILHVFVLKLNTSFLYCIQQFFYKHAQKIILVTCNNLFTLHHTCTCLGIY